MKFSEKEHNFISLSIFAAMPPCTYLYIFFDLGCSGC